MTYKIIWHSNAPWTGSGYGNQTQLFTSLMQQDPDFEPVVSAFYGLKSAPITAGGMKVLPGAFHEFGQDVMAARWDALKADAFVGLIDVWVYESDVLKSRPFTWWAPVDHNPIPPNVADKLQYVRYPWAMSKHGYAEMVKIGVNPRYVPHGTNTEHFKPIPRQEARKKFDFIEDDTFLFVSVAANKGKEDRKNLRTLIHAFAQVLQDHPNIKLYIHTIPTALYDGFNLEMMVNQLGLQKHVFFPDMFNIVEGLYQHPYLNALYNAADVFILPSAGEGFGIPVIEAQSAGCPVIVNDFTAQGELCGAGFKIAIDSDDLEYSVFGSYRARVRTSKVVTAMKLSLEWQGDDALRKMARDFSVTNYDYKRVWDKHMKPALVEQIEQRKADEEAARKNTRERLAMREAAKNPVKIEETTGELEVIA